MTTWFCRFPLFHRLVSPWRYCLQSRLIHFNGRSSFYGMNMAPMRTPFRLHFLPAGRQSVTILLRQLCYITEVIYMNVFQISVSKTVPSVHFGSPLLYCSQTYAVPRTWSSALCVYCNHFIVIFCTAIRPHRYHIVGDIDISISSPEYWGILSYFGKVLLSFGLIIQR
jgi:hypothetical protein